MLLQIAAAIFRNKRAYSRKNLDFSMRVLQQAYSHLRKLSFLLLLLQLAFVMLLLSFVRSTSAQESTPHRILFVSERDGNREIYVVNDDGTDLQNLTNNPAEDAYPSWSPDGERIAFQSNRDGDWEIYVMDSDGENVRNLTNNSANDERPSWTPEGEMDGCVVRSIFFESNRGDKWSVYSIGGAGEDVHEWTYLIQEDVRDPILSPDSCTIAYHIRSENGWLLYIADTYTLQPYLIAGLGSDDGMFSWSPNSLHIAFERNGEIYVVDIFDYLNQTISPPRNFTLNDAYDSSPAWSPAGNQIAYVSNWDIYTMDAADGRNPYNLTQTPTYDLSPAWSSDAQQIAFASFRDENWEIYAMNSDGCNARRLTDDEGWDGLPQWQPQPNVSATAVVERTPTAIVNTPNANLRDGPGENYNIAANGTERECLSIIGRTTDGAWLQIQHGDVVLWVSSSIVDIVGDTEMILVIQP